tara:strand:- start:3624 stop:3998 length:375 start_codon:yes stop_codon:yes gene_type:complete
MNEEKYILPDRLPVDREGLSSLIFEVNAYAGKLKAEVHHQEKFLKKKVAYLCKKHKGNKSGKEAEWHAYDDPEYEKFIDELKELEVELYRANAMTLAVEHHQKDLSQDKALDRIKIEKGIYDLT